MESSRMNCPAKSRYMNSRASGNEAYIPTELEHMANVVTHGIWVGPSIAGMIILLQRCSSGPQCVSGMIYGSALVTLFLVSTIFHSVFYIGRFRSMKEILHVCDRAVIYIFIAASYTPWLLINGDNSHMPGYQFCCIVWIMALVGILYQYYFHERYKSLETAIYIVIGIAPAIFIYKVHRFNGFRELISGGLVYIVGVLFFKSDGRIPCAHAIWHMFVNIGASFHFYAVYKYLLLAENDFRVKSS